MPPRHNAIVAALRAILGVSGAGPHLSRYHCFCPEPGALDFLGHLYEVGLNKEDLEAPGQVGREAVHALLAPLGKLSDILLMLERGRSWKESVRSGKVRGSGLILHLASQFGVTAHYLAAVGTELDEAAHRRLIPVEAVAGLKWEVTEKWLLEDGEGVVWYWRADRDTTRALTNLLRLVPELDPRLAEVFWDTMGAADLADLLRWLEAGRFNALVERLRSECLSARLLGETISVEEVVEQAPRERIAAFLEILVAWLGGLELPAGAGVPRTPSPPPATGGPPPLPADDERDPPLGEDGIEVADIE